MSVFRRYQFYKKLLILLMVANAFVFALSLIEFVNYYNFQTEFRDQLANAPGLQDLYLQSQSKAKITFLIGAFAFFIGVLLPSFVMYKLNLSIYEMRKKTEKQFVSWLNVWVKNYGAMKADVKSPFYNRPDFWLNMALITLETYGPHAKNPVLNYLADLAPLLRNEISKDKENSDSES